MVRRMQIRNPRPETGFTLIELLVVIIIIVILAGMSVMLMSNFMKGQGVKQGTNLLASAFANARQYAADKRLVHFLVFSNAETRQVNVVYRRKDGTYGLIETGDGAATADA